MNKLKERLKKLPFISFVYRELRLFFAHYYLKMRSRKNVFTNIYRKKMWKGLESLSGPGSDFCETRIISRELQSLLDEFKINTMLDVPCGDFHWMRNLNLNKIDYIGADIVTELVEQNIKKHAKDKLCFRQLDIVKDELPKVDLIFCRDCLVHFSDTDIFGALDNICKSQSKYLLTTIFTARKENYDILTGDWRPLSLESPPFNLQEKLKILEEPPEYDRNFQDKAMALWKIDNIRKCLKKSQ